MLASGVVTLGLIHHKPDAHHVIAGSKCLSTYLINFNIKSNINVRCQSFWPEVLPTSEVRTLIMLIVMNGPGKNLHVNICGEESL